MARLIEAPTVLEAAGEPPKTISEYIGRLATADGAVSIAVMESPAGWSEPTQRPEFDEYTVVLRGALRVETADGALDVTAGQAVHAPAGGWVRYSTPSDGGATYVAVCIPAFSPEMVHRDVPAG
jgi:mannose-6-phosphate isomerase-like protein (cupin superfamily)